MSQRHPYAMVAGLATLMAAFPLSTVFHDYTWLAFAAFAVAAVVGTAMLVRTARGPVWLQVLAMMAALLVYLTVTFPSGHEFFRLIPTASTFHHFNDMLLAAGDQIRTTAPPVPDLEGLLLLTTAGIGLMAVLVDLAAVGLRRPALAGLPMLALYSVPVGVLPDTLPVLTFVVAASGYLWLLVSDSVDRVRRFGRRFTGEGRDVELWEPSPLASAGRRLGVVGVVIAMLLPLAVPDLSNGLFNFNGPGNGPGVGTGTGPELATVNLNTVLADQLHRDSNFVMVQVTTNDPSPFYLKFGVADLVSADGFNNRAPSGGTPVDRPISDPGVPTSGVVSDKYQATIHAINFNMGLAPAYQQLTGVQELEPSWSYDESTGQVFARRDSINGKTYKIEYVHLNYSPKALRTAAPFQGQDSAALRDLLAIPPNAQISQLVHNLTDDKTTEYDKVLALYEFFKPDNGFVYSLNAPKGNSGSAIVDFIDGRQGFCVQYATALAWLVRAAGFPARVAFGFTRGTGPVQGTYNLTNYNLHAWTEVLFPGFGWVPFDATPTASITGSVPTPWSPDLSKPLPADNGDAGDLAPKPGPSGSAGPVGANGDEIPTAGATFVTPHGWLYYSGIAAVVLLIALALAPAVRRRVLRVRRRARAGIGLLPDASASAVGGGTVHNGRMRPPMREIVDDPDAVPLARADAHAAWSEMIDTLVDFDVLVDPAETPRATAERLRELPAFAPVAQEAATLIARAEERARYARMPLRSDGLDPAVRTVRAALADRATFRQRLLAAMLPRSVTLRWRTSWVGWVSRSVRSANRVRAGLAVVNPRRLLARGSVR